MNDCVSGDEYFGCSTLLFLSFFYILENRFVSILVDVKNSNKFADSCDKFDFGVFIFVLKKNTIAIVANFDST